MAATRAGGPAPSAKAGAPAPADGKAARPAPKPAASPADAAEARKRRLMITFMVFNFVFMPVMGVVYYMGRPPSFFLSLGIALPAAALIAGGYYLFAPKQ
jgi:hypothetical protein